MVNLFSKCLIGLQSSLGILNGLTSHIAKRERWINCGAWGAGSAVNYSAAFSLCARSYSSATRLAMSSTLRDLGGSSSGSRFLSLFKTHLIKLTTTQKKKRWNLSLLEDTTLQSGIKTLLGCLSLFASSDRHKRPRMASNLPEQSPDNVRIPKNMYMKRPMFRLKSPAVFAIIHGSNNHRMITHSLGSDP
jgi:hypothetical protein